MSKATLMVFILDQLPGFSDVLNMTFDVFSRTNPDISVSHPQYCDPTLAEPILGVVNQQFLKIDPKYKNIITPINQDIDLSAYDETLDAINYLKNLRGMEMSKSKKASHQALLELANVSFMEKMKKSFKNTSLQPKLVPVRLQSASSLEEFALPYLVAIFETLSNVTAQTCGGVLMAPKWVLTSADCLNMLKDFNIAGNNANASSSYSTIVGARNPLEDGKAYNVTDIFIYPNLTKMENKLFDSCKKNNRSKLALMKIRPSKKDTNSARQFKPLPIFKNVDKENVTVLGWSMLNGSFSNDIRPKHMSGIVYHCLLGGNETNWCLNVTNDITTQITAGGPILVRRDTRPGLLALLTAAEDPPYSVVPLETCSTWIDDVITNK